MEAKMRRSSCTTLGVERVSRHRLSSSGSLISLNQPDPAPGALLQALIGHEHTVYLPLCLSICPLASARCCGPRHGEAHRLVLFHSCLQRWLMAPCQTQAQCRCRQGLRGSPESVRRQTAAPRGRNPEVKEPRATGLQSFWRRGPSGPRLLPLRLFSCIKSC